MASRSASRTVIVTISVPCGTSGSGAAFGCGGEAAADLGCAGTGVCLLSCFSGDAGSAAFSCGAGFAAAAAEASSPSPRITAIGVLTATSAVPSGMRILPSVPSSTASTSMVALSVSISAITSPDLTLSPSRLSHFARLPFSIVGDRAGINTWIGIERESSTRSLGVDVGVEFGRIGLGIVGGVFGGFVDGLAHLGVDLLELVFTGPFLLHEPQPHLLDRVVLAAHLLDLFAGAVLRRVGHRVAAIAVGQHLQDDRAVAAAAPLRRMIGGGLDGAHIHAVDLLAGNAVGRAAQRQLGGRRRALQRGAHRILVVLDDVDCRQAPQL